MAQASGNGTASNAAVDTKRIAGSGPDARAARIAAAQARVQKAKAHLAGAEAALRAAEKGK